MKRYVVEFWFKGEYRDAKVFHSHKEAMDWMDKHRTSIYDFRLEEVEDEP